MASDTTVPVLRKGDDPFGLVGGRLEGKYDIQAVVAEGGFGVVYRGIHRTLHKPIAVKVLKVPEGLGGPCARSSSTSLPRRPAPSPSLNTPPSCG